MLKKDHLKQNQEIVLKITLEGGVLNEETLSEKFGSDKGKLIPTDIGNDSN